MGSQTLELKWANHKSNMISELQELYSSDALFDVTIACGENTVKAHKTVLSASSAFFRKLFTDNPCQHPILIMTDVDFRDVKTIVEFMYQGEIHISREKLTHFLKIADRLKVKGLTNIENINLNPPEGHEVDVASPYPTDTMEHTSIQTQPRDTNQTTHVQSSSEMLTDSVQNDTNKEIPIIKLEDDLEPADSGSCMYWQSECFDQTSSSSVVPDYSLSSPSASHQQLVSTAPHQLPTSSISHQLLGSSVSHQLPAASVSHQLPLTTVSHQLATPSVPNKATEPCSSHQLRAPLDDEGFTYSDNQTDNIAVSRIQEENTGNNINPPNLYLSQDQSTVTVPPTTKPSFETVESLSSHSSSQDGNADNKALAGRNKCVIVEGIAAFSKGTFHSSEDVSYKKCNTVTVCNSSCKTSLFLKKTILDKHLKFHFKSVKFTCDICNNEFSSKRTLEEHLGIHIREKPCFSGESNDQFAQLSGLQTHEITYNGGKRFACKFCHKHFSGTTVLKLHERTHTGEKPFLCKVCHKRFSRKYVLQRHEGIHARDTMVTHCFQ